MFYRSLLVFVICLFGVIYLIIKLSARNALFHYTTTKSKKDLNVEPWSIWTDFSWIQRAGLEANTRLVSLIGSEQLLCLLKNWNFRSYESATNRDFNQNKFGLRPIRPITHSKPEVWKAEKSLYLKDRFFVFLVIS